MEVEQSSDVASNFEQIAEECEIQVPVTRYIPSDYFSPSNSLERKVNKIYHSRDDHHVPKRLRGVYNDVHEIFNETDQEYDDDCFIVDDQLRVESGSTLEEEEIQVTSSEKLLMKMVNNNIASQDYDACIDYGIDLFFDWITNERFGKEKDEYFNFFRSKVSYILGPVCANRIKFNDDEYAMEKIPHTDTETYNAPNKCCGCGHTKPSAWYIHIGTEKSTMGSSCGKIHYLYKELKDYLIDMKNDILQWKMTEKGLLGIEIIELVTRFKKLNLHVKELHLNYCK